MKNIERWSSHMTKYGSNSYLVHTVPGTQNWLICQKIEENKWTLILGNPMGNVTYNLGTVTNDQHLQIWKHLTMTTIENKVSQLNIANQYKATIKHFLKNYETPQTPIQKEKETSPEEYKKTITKWKKENPSKTKQQRSKLRQRPKGPKNPIK